MRAGKTGAVLLLALSGCATVTSDYTLHTLFRKVPGHKDAFAGGSIGIRWAGNWIYVYGSPPCVRFRYPDGLRKDLGEKASQLAISPDGRHVFMRIWPWKREFRHVVYPLDEDGDIADESTMYRDPFEREENSAFVAWTSHPLPVYSLNSIPDKDRGLKLHRWTLDGEKSEALLEVHFWHHDTIGTGPEGSLWITGIRGKRPRKIGRYNYFFSRSYVVDMFERWQRVTEMRAGVDQRAHAISPDGRFLALVVSSSTKKGSHKKSPRDIWIVRLRDGGLVKVAHSEAFVHSVAFSPDSKKLAIFAWQWATAGYKVVRMPANLVVVELEEALARLDGGLSAEEEAEAKLLVEKTKLRTWDLEHAPVMTLEEVKAFRQGKSPGEPESREK